MLRRQRVMLLILPMLVLLAALALLVNSMGCRYELRSTHHNIDYYGVCRGGFVDIVETDLSTGSQWTVHAFQFALANQLLFMVHDRTQVRPSRDDTRSVLDTYNQAHGSFGMINYAWMPVDSRRVVFFQTSPRHDVLTLTRDGPLSLWDEYFPPQPPDF
ncbi:MAG: hypothetical protein QM639_13200 [Rhodocyclaceae bacterium]